VFKNKSFHVKLVNDKKVNPQNAEPTVPPNSPESIAIEVAGAVGGVAVLVIAAYKSADTLSKIAIHIAETKIK
jgi:hypothetical protein